MPDSSTLAGTPLSPKYADVSAALTLLEILDRPTDAYAHVVEKVTPAGGELVRHVTVQLTDTWQTRAHETGILLPILKPRKGISEELIFESRSGLNVRMMNHAQHSRVARFMLEMRINFLFEMYSSASPGLPRFEFIKNFSRLRLLEITGSDVSDEGTARKLLSAYFFQDGWLCALPRVDSDVVRAEMRLLYDLCLTLTHRYFRIATLSAEAEWDGVVSYQYDQAIRDRGTNAKGFAPPLRRLLHRAFNAPYTEFEVHIPLARRTAHYEISMTPLTGYYPTRAAVNLEPAARVKASGYRNLHLGVSTPGRSSPKLFIGNGRGVAGRLFADFEFREIPPGTHGRALTTSMLTMVLIVPLIFLLEFRVPTKDADVNQNFIVAISTLLITFLGFASALSDSTMPKNEISTSPLGPRLLMLLQTLVLTALVVMVFAGFAAAWKWAMVIVLGAIFLYLLQATIRNTWIFQHVSNGELTKGREFAKI